MWEDLVCSETAAVWHGWSRVLSPWHVAPWQENSVVSDCPLHLRIFSWYPLLPVLVMTTKTVPWCLFPVSLGKDPLWWELHKWRPEAMHESSDGGKASFWATNGCETGEEVSRKTDISWHNVWVVVDLGVLWSWLQKRHLTCRVPGLKPPLGDFS